MGDVDPDGDALTAFDALTPFDAFTDLEALTNVDAFTDLDHPVIDSEHQRDLKHIVDSLLARSPSASLDRFPTSRLMRQVKPKLVVDDPKDLETCDVINDGYTRVGRRGDESELIQGLLGAGEKKGD